MDDTRLLRIANLVRGHIPALDGLRGIAIAVVVVHNTGMVQVQAHTFTQKLLMPIHQPGWVGVHLFFVLSGFLITGILLDTKDASRVHEGAAGVGAYFRSFYVRRALRIFPLYYATLAVAFLVAPHVLRFSSAHAAAFRWQGWYWAYLDNWTIPYGKEIDFLSHFWSLGVEEQFYLVWPFIVLASSPRNLLRASVALAVVALGVRAVLVATHQPPLASYMFTGARMDALVLGAAAAVIARDGAAMRRAWRWLTPVMAATGLAMLACVPFSHGFARDAAVVQVVGHSLLAVFFTAFLLRAVGGSVAAPGADRLSRALDVAPLRWLGK